MSLHVEIFDSVVDPEGYEAVCLNIDEFYRRLDHIADPFIDGGCGIGDLRPNGGLLDCLRLEPPAPFELILSDLCSS